MKKVLLIFLIPILVISCNNSNSSDTTGNTSLQSSMEVTLTDQNAEQVTQQSYKKNKEKPNKNEQSILGTYTNGAVYLIVYAFDNGEDFKGVLLDRANQFAVTGIYGAKTKTGYIFETVHNKTDENSMRCDIDLTFNKDQVTFNNPDNCFNLNVTLTKTKDYNTPKAGNYGNLEIKKVADYSFKFKASVNEGSLSCTGEIGEDDYATAYGINGVYVFDDYDFEGGYGCLILITCKGKTITFSEIGICAYHGANCSFNGQYTMK